MTNKRLLAILIIVLAFIFLAVLVYFLFFFKFTEDINIFREQEVAEQLSGNENTLSEIRQIVKQIPQKENNEMPVATDEEVSEANLIKIAASFAERFGSYSNHSDYENISDLKIFMSKKMIAWADDFVKSSRKESGSSRDYEGITTKAFSTKVLKLDKNTGNAQMLVKTQRIASNGSEDSSNTKIEDILIVFIKEAGTWKVDGAHWQ